MGIPVDTMASAIHPPAASAAPTSSHSEMQHTDLTNQFLIAMPGLKDPNFEKSVTYICAHNPDGAMGIVINKPLDIELGQVFKQMQIKSDNRAACRKVICHGGPVHTDRGFILHHASRQWDSSFIVSEDICVTTSKDILEAMASGDGPEEALIALGYAGWTSGQLERELLANTWLSGPVDCNIMFNTPFEECWQSAAGRLGVDLDRLSPDIGHA